MISKPHFFTVILMNLTVVLMWLRDGKGGGGETLSMGGLPRLCLTLTCIIGKDF